MTLTSKEEKDGIWSVFSVVLCQHDTIICMHNVTWITKKALQYHQTLFLLEGGVLDCHIILAAYLNDLTVIVLKIQILFEVIEYLIDGSPKLCTKKLL